MRTRRSAAPSKRSSTRQELRASRPRGGADRHLLPVHGVAADRGVDLAGGAGGHAEHEGEVLLLDRAPGELPDERAVRRRRPWRPPAGPRCRGRGGGRCRAAGRRRRRRGRARGGAARSRACRAPCRRRGARRGRRACSRRAGGRPRAPRPARCPRAAAQPGTGAGTVTRADLSGAQAGRGPRAGPVEQDAALVDQRLEAGAGEGRQALREPGVESQARGLPRRRRGSLVIPRDSGGTGPEESAAPADPSSPGHDRAPRGDKRPYASWSRSPGSCGRAAGGPRPPAAGRWR